MQPLPLVNFSVVYTHLDLCTLLQTTKAMGMSTLLCQSYNAMKIVYFQIPFSVLRLNLELQSWYVL